MQHRIMVFIPVYNCEKQIKRVLGSFNKEILKFIDEIYVVDNRSQDNTLLYATEAAKNISGVNITITKNDQNYSLGGSIKRALLYGLENNYSHLIVLHGDDQGNIQDLLPYFQNRTYENYDMFIGARFHPMSILKGYSFTRRLGNQVLNKVFQMIAKRKIYDLIAGLNVFKLEYFRSLFFLPFPDNLTFDAHLLLYGIHNNAKIDYFPISWKEEDQISNAKTVKQALIILKLVAKYLIIKDRVFTNYNSIYDEKFMYPSTIQYQNNNLSEIVHEN